MFKKIKMTDVLVVFFLIFSVGFIAHFTLIAPMQFMRVVYPIQAYFYKKELSCSAGAPYWMQQAIQFSVENNGSLTNQLTYISPNGQISNCANGWKDTMFFSDAVTTQTRFRYASLTKPITADLILSLVNQKKLHLDDTMVSFFPELTQFQDERIRNIRIENLLTHSSGFDRLKSNDPLFNFSGKPWCPYHLKKLESIKLDFDPNQKYAYDNRNYCFLGLIAEKVTGKSYRQLINENYPIQKLNIQFIDGPFKADEVRYDFRNEYVFTQGYIRQFDFAALSPVAGLSGSTEAYAKLIQQLLHQPALNLLSESKLNTTCELKKVSSCFRLGLTVYQSHPKALTVYRHDGGLPAVRTLLIVDQYGGVTVWAGNGVQPIENKTEYLMFKHLYQLLVRHYQ